MSSRIRLGIDKLGNLFGTAGRQRIQLRRDTAANWTAANPVLEMGEPGVETDTRRFRIGDGVTPWTSLRSFSMGPDGEVRES